MAAGAPRGKLRHGTAGPVPGGRCVTPGVAWKRQDTLGGLTAPRSGDIPAWSPPCPPVRRQRHLTLVPGVATPLPARARRVTFEDEVVTARGRAQEKPGDSAVSPKVSPRPGAVSPEVSPSPGAVADYVARYPAIRSPRQRAGYLGVFQDQRQEFRDLLRELRDTRHPPGSTDPSRLQKQRRCEYLKEKLSHLKARIRDYDRASPAAS
ncbi:occludin/ELL domain-containing protein 1 [Corvus hawaiiensis]|uniref:occludin/ELL domain-containing protein 1 n=1 Tax=Corvus hawaiiensis TaxID=134902 RepID=UPI00201969D7|nr:occludin/ELL domain-containing protein 1 [Corvus hawaiiensis]